MMNVKCPQGDKGVCTIPDRSAVVTADSLTVQHRDEVVGAYPRLDLSEARLTEVDASDVGDGIVEALSASGTAREGAARTALLSAFERSPAKITVVVHCSCGHIYLADLPA